MEKVDEIDFNGNSVAEETGQSEKTEVKEEKVEEKVEAKAEAESEETVESLKEKLKKTEEDKENYKKGMLKYKDKTLTKETEEETTEDYPEWDENSKKFQEQTKKEAAQEARKIVEQFNEKAATSKFISEHPELEDESKWNEVVSNYHPKNGKETVASIEKDLERAYFLTRFERGEITNLEKEAFEKGKKKGKAESEVEDLSSVSKTTSKSVKNDGKSVSEGALRLAQAMRVDPEKLAKEDDSLIAEINL